MRRTFLAITVSLLFGVAVVQENAGDASLRINTEPPQALITISGPEGFMTLLDVAGSEEITGLSPGRYFVVATAQGHDTAQAQVELAAGTSESVSLTLEPLEGQPEGAQQDGGDQSGDQQQTDGQSEGGNGDGQQSQESRSEEGQQDGEGGEGQSDQADGQEDDGQNGQGGEGGEGQGGQAEGQDQQGGGENGAVAGGGQAPDPQLGEQIYSQECAQCHGPDGGGGSGPALAGNSNLEDAQAAIDQIVNGGGGMPAFGNQLSDEEIAAVATHIRTSWDNQFGEVTVEQVSGDAGGAGSGAGEQQEQQAAGGQQQDGQQQAGQASGQSQSGGISVQVTVPAEAAPLTVTIDLQPGEQAQQQAPQDGQQDGQQQDGQSQQQDGQQQNGQQQDQGDSEGQDNQEGQSGGGQSGQSQGWYSQRQAQVGSEAYFTHCSACHGTGLEGRAPYPPVAGSEFLAAWDGRSVAELYDYISSTMPDDRPGELDQRTYEHVTAYILQQNGFPAGNDLRANSDAMAEQTIGQDSADGERGDDQGDQQQEDGQSQQAQGEDEQQDEQQNGQQQDEQQADQERENE